MGSCCSKMNKERDDEVIELTTAKIPDDSTKLMKTENFSTAALNNPILPSAPLLQSISFETAEGAVQKNDSDSSF